MSDNLPTSNDISSVKVPLIQPDTIDGGMRVDDTNTSSTQPASPSFDRFDFLNPIELLFVLDDDIASGNVKLHNWQKQFMLDFADEQNEKSRPFKAEVRACNGSGKDKYVVAACAVWLCMRYPYSRAIATNGSGVQLDNQTEVYIRHLCDKANQKFGMIVWKCNYRYYECLVTHSPITLFATDEPNKAEGYHPLIPGAKMAIFASEAKAIPDTIFTALTRCTGFTHRVDVSTPGLPMGYFFDRCSTAIPRKNLSSIKEVKETDNIEYHITAYDCPHITNEEIHMMKDTFPGGENGSAFKSAVLAEFGTTDEMVVIPFTYVHWAFTYAPDKLKHIPEEFNKAGLDLSDGGDETVLVVRNGNKHLVTIPFKFDNTEDTVEFLNEKFREYDLDNPNAFIYGDAGGLGKPILDRLRGMGWKNVRYVDNRNKASQPKVYLNRGTELFFHIRKLLERKELIMLKDDKLIRQLSTRYYKMDTNNRHRLLSKLEMRSRGYPSPDRADAFCLAFWSYKSTFHESASEYAKEVESAYKSKYEEKPKNDFSLKQWAKTEDTPFKPSVKRPNMEYLMEQIDQHNKQIKEQNEIVNLK